ncbi:MAG: class I SAM-dependent methyltransferase [Actinomycetota bacterium]
MFTGSARYYDAIYAWKDYADEAEVLHQTIQQRNPWAQTLLDVACGTGRHLEHLRKNYTVEGLDLDPELLQIAAGRLPNVPLHLGDMAEFDLGRTFDVVTCLFSSIAYAKTRENLDRAVANLARHTSRRGLVILEPWILPEDYRYDEVHATFVDEPALKIARINTSGPRGPVTVLDFQYTVGTPEGIETFTERHEVGLFAHEEYLEALTNAGLTAHHSPHGLMGRGLYVGVRSR